MCWEYALAATAVLSSVSLKLQLALPQEDVFLGTDQVEQETAWAMDFSAMAIVEEEEGIIPSKANELDYVKVKA